MARDDHIQMYLDLLSRGAACSWCKDHNRTLHGKRMPLCGHCHRIAREIRKFERLAATRPRRHLLFPDNIYDKLDTFRKMRVLAEAEGGSFGDINVKEVDGLDLEHELAFLSKKVAGKNLYSHDASMLGQSFSPVQRRLLLYLLSRMSRVIRKERRPRRAQYQVFLDQEAQLGKQNKK